MSSLSFFAKKAITYLDNQIKDLRLQQQRLLHHQKEFLDHIELIVNLILKEARESRVYPQKELSSVQTEFEPHERRINEELQRIAEEMYVLYTFKNETEQEIREAEIYEELQKLPIYDNIYDKVKTKKTRGGRC
jgi:hypothetical protein